MKKLLILLLFCSTFLEAQTIVGNKVLAKTVLQLSGYNVTGITNDSALGTNSIMKLPTEYAVKNYVARHGGSLPSQTGNSGKYLQTNGTSVLWQTISGGTPAGSTGQVQYNNSGAFGASSNLFWDNTNSNITIGNSGTTLGARLGIKGSGSTSASTSLLVQNSSATNLMTLKDDGSVVHNTISGFTGNILNAQVNGSSKFTVDETGRVSFSGMLYGEFWRTPSYYGFYQPTSLFGGNDAVVFNSSILSGNNANQKFLNMSTTINKTGTGGYTGIYFNAIETALSSGQNYLIDLSTSGTSKFNVKNTGQVNLAAPIVLKNYTVATLPTGTQGMTAYVTDALAPTYLGTAVGGGAIVAPVFYNGSAWVTH